MRPCFRLLTVMAALAAAVASPLAARSSGLFTSLPIRWPEASDMSSLLNAMDRPHWALGVLAKEGALRPVDRVMPGPSGLDGLDLLIMAQPRPLAPDENAALDRWLHSGGRLLLFADPLLTADSAFAIGDRRRPEALAMVQPLLRHWGLRMQTDPDQLAGEHNADVFGAAVPVDLPGRLIAVSGAGRCRMAKDGVAALCRIGRGRALIVADAALFDSPEGKAPDRAAALTALLARIAS